MDKLLRVLHLEDDPDFPHLVGALLAKDGIPAEIQRAADYSAFVTALERGSFDIILADYSLPSCDGLLAVKTAREKSPDTPVLLVSGTIGEQAAIDSLKCGATDYVLKSALERLLPAVRRAVLESRERARLRRAEAEVRESEKQYRLIFEGNPIPSWIADLETEAFLEVNGAATRHYGYDRSEMLSLTLRDIRPPEEAARARHYFHEIVRRQSPGSIGNAGLWRHRKKCGALIDVEITWSVIVFRGREALLTMAQDVTERRRHERREAALSKLGGGLSSATSPIEAAHIIKDVADELFGWDCFALGVYQEGTDAFRPILKVDTLEGRRQEMDLARWLDKPDAVVRRVMEHGAELIQHAEEDPGADTELFGSKRRLAASRMLVPVRIDSRVIGMIALARFAVSAYDHQDLNAMQILADQCAGALERIHAEEALRESERRLRQSESSLAAAQRIAHLGSWELDLSNRDDIRHNELRWSDETYRIFGLEPRQVPASTDLFYRFVHPDDRQRVAEAAERACATRGVYDIEHRIVLAGGEERIVRERAEFSCDPEGNPRLMHGIVMDVTERKQLEEQLRQSQKMEAIGQLAGGVAHDFNNILTVIHGYAAMLTEEEQLKEFARRAVNQIIQASERAADLTRQLLTFSRRQVLQPRALDLNEVVSNMTLMLGRILGEDISLQLDYWPQPAMIQADSSMIQQVLLNLAVNARDALPDGGQLNVRIHLEQVDPGRAASHPESREGAFVCLSVSDNGCGIAPENLRRIFEPFFTTKEVGKGTGLGLATVYGIVQQHQGWIEVESEPGLGATFRVYLPLHTEAVDSDAATPAEQEPAISGVPGPLGVGPEKSIV
ncbi:MAG: PAS domain S-box protein [Verrucomicrobiota bacterium]